MAGRTYRDFGGKPVYPFGYGQSFTSFAYTPLTVSLVGSGQPETGVPTSGGAFDIATSFPVPE
ncbi:hypothetical protein EOE18_07275 [Novosphingobium umbonatum]|uniref:Glycoside hydrolase family 3 C-terminal domain-containing protein n=1 Tax=Novosphingobium umbonatum TaxID=1908524 RepID=A0A3S2X4T4_9SPHN|nr:hypothetical protein [Novosphingobium umbonatum]RVU05777.1 hypothetical protein EOE18_07275 [Novosphingobium umbonatum]